MDQARNGGLYNDFKGGWGEMKPGQLLDYLKSSVDQLEIAHSMAFLDEDEDKLMSAILITKECIDAANYAMMIADLHAHKFGK